ncbi:heavy-metal-associated domain-containing protein [Amycolatopsis roodepoortensis]|uniref:heavy-metal-associated domain-containing protein n=1 Tax=Amycolatopsis roodepoortensis TaxID=700274 RepID=UPI00214CB9C7|nr:heavy-metal-associated domain-containing protein [Amycolatopsis roodepoortensis]UUV28217.1 heavy-metal-associated domain-containing protein [Amycolatopsis roodepoortensis]
MSARTYAVRGMACGHCAVFVAEEIETIAGVTAVAVDVDDGTVTVSSDQDLDIDDVRAAVEEAGYELTGT